MNLLISLATSFQVSAVGPPANGPSNCCTTDSRWMSAAIENRRCLLELRGSDEAKGVTGDEEEGQGEAVGEEQVMGQGWKKARRQNFLQRHCRTTGLP